MTETMSAIPDFDRDALLQLPDDALLRRCRMEFTKATGHGGQKRNKCSTAVRITLDAAGISVTDCSSRSQFVNRRTALWKLRLELARRIRVQPALPPPRPDCAVDHPDYPLFLARLLDALHAADAEPKAAAPLFGATPTHLVKLLFRDPASWEAVNRRRADTGRPGLRA